MPYKATPHREFSATVSQPDEDGYCIVRIWRGETQFSAHVIRSDQADQWAAQELDCLREYIR